MLPISCQSLNEANSGSRGPREELKKRKSSEFNHRNDEQVQSSFEGSNLDPKNVKISKPKLEAVGPGNSWSRLITTEERY